MHRTQVYFEEQVFESIKQKAKMLDLSVSAYIRDIVKKDLQTQKENNKQITTEFSGLWKDYDVSIESIRKKAWK